MKALKFFLIFILTIAGPVAVIAQDSGLVRVSVAHMRAEGKEQSEMVSQALMGTPVKILQKKGSWKKVETPDGYTGWMDAGSIVEKTAKEMAAWRKAPRLVMTNPYQIHVFEVKTPHSTRDAVSDLVNGDIVEGNLDNSENGKIIITLPDGRKAWANQSDFTPIEEWANQEFDPEVIIDQAFACLGAPYLWGGLSTKATDCSGLVRLSYFANGRLLRRDASQQIHTGTALDPKDFNSFRPTDLLFFGNKATGKIGHVAMYIGNNQIIHSSLLVRCNSILPDDPDYYNREIIGATRIAGNDDTPGIWKVINHPAYF